MRKKIIAFLLSLGLCAQIALAAPPNITSDSEFWEMSTNGLSILPRLNTVGSALFDIGSVGNEIPSGYFTNIVAGSITGSFSPSGDLDMDGNSILDVEQITYTDHTTQYVDASTGNDTTGDGSISTPYATIGKALSNVPYEINEKYQILVANDTYSESFDSVSHVYSPSGQLTIDGYEDVVNVAGPFSVTGSTAFGVFSGTEIEVSSAGWTTDEYYADFIKFTTGSNAGTVYPIYSNDTDSLITNAYFASVSPGDQFYVVTPGVQVEMSNPIHFETSAPSTYYNSHFGISNVTFDFDSSNPTIIGGDGPILLQAVLFKKASGQILEIEGGNINSSALYDSSGFTNSNYANAYSSGVATQINDTVPTSQTDYVRVSNSGGINTGVNLGYFMVRNGVNMTARASVIQFSTIDHATIDHASYGNIIYSYVNTKSGYTVPDIRIDDFSRAEVEFVYFGNCAIECVRAEDGVKAFFDGVSGVTGPTYGLKVQDADDILVGTSGATLTGSSGDIQIDSTGEVLSWPSAGDSFSKSDSIYSGETNVTSSTPTINLFDTDYLTGVEAGAVEAQCTSADDCDFSLKQRVDGVLTTFLSSDADGFLGLGVTAQGALAQALGIVDADGDFYHLFYPNPDNGAIIGLSNTDGDSNNRLIITTLSNLTKEFGLNSPAPDTEICLFSNDDVEADNTKRMCMHHDGNDSYFETLTGNSIIDAPDGVELYDGGGLALGVSNDGTKTNLQPPTGDYTAFGGETTSHGLIDDGDVVAAKIEANGNFYADAAFILNNDLLLSGGGSITTTSSGNITLNPDTTGNVLIDARLKNPQGADIASAGNLVLGYDGNTFEITGTTTINLLSQVGWDYGDQVTLICNESVTFSDAVATSGDYITMLLAGSSDFNCTADDVLVLKLSETTATGRAWREVSRSIN